MYVPYFFASSHYKVLVLDDDNISYKIIFVIATAVYFKVLKICGIIWK